MPKAKAVSSSKASKALPKKAGPIKKAVVKKPPVKKAAPTKAVSKSKPAAKAVKKAPVAPKRNASTKSDSGSKSLELCLLLDCTSSMFSWIQRSQETLCQIIDHVKNENKGLTVRVGFVAYRDIQDHPRFDITDFTENVDLVKQNVKKQPAQGGGDFPEDVQGGFNKALNLSWTKDSLKSVFHIADAPGHGRDICDSGDWHPNGSPDGFKIQDQMRDFAKRGISFTFVKVNEMCNKMIKVMQENYDPSGNTMNITDLSNACATKSNAEVTKDFVNAASFILSAVVGGGKGGKKSAAAKKVKRTTKPLWDPKKFEEKQWFSQTTYLQVKEIAGNKLTVENSYGNALYVSKDIVEDMYSADHFKKEVPVNMTFLAELLHSVQDHIFTVVFRKQPTEENAIELLEKTDAKTFKDAKKVNQLAKDMIAGQTVKMTCHLIQVENNLGRSLVIDLDAKGNNKFRQIDHRTLDYIIFQNVKYVLKKGAKQPEEEKRNKDEPKWDSKQLAVGNWFSGTSYYQAVTDKGDQVLCRSSGKDIEISKDILEYEMHNSGVYEEEQKIPLTQVATVLAEANSKCFTVTFTTKVDEKQVQEKLSGVKGKLNAAQIKELAKDVLTGEEKTLTGRLSRAEGKLGRSLVIDLPSQGYRQVDHRTLKSLVVDNIKYIVKK